MRFLLLLCCALLAGCASNPPAITQVSTIDALLASAYDGVMPLGELKAYGALGLGTPDHIDGELILLDGVGYVARGDGSVAVLSDAETIAFASVADESEGLPCTFRDVDFASFTARADERIGNPNEMVAVRFKGRFSRMGVRSETRQEPPYRPLAEVMKDCERRFEYADVEGELVGFRLPPFMKGLNAPGWHLHFLSADRTKGGHVYGFSATSLEGSVFSYRRFQTLLPDSGHAFHALDQTLDRSQDLKTVEGHE